MECEKCKSKRIRVINVIETPILDEKNNRYDLLTTFKMKCLECNHQFKEECFDC